MLAGHRQNLDAMFYWRISYEDASTSIVVYMVKIHRTTAIHVPTLNISYTSINTPYSNF
jgi:hypothetical protein